jgi:pSer/pThr/pTyr-binding forkhead associated (FHA) protein
LNDNKSTNGTLLQRRGEEKLTRVFNVPLNHGDVITFGGAHSTEFGESPGEKATKSIYTYKFII